jgi:hypothetical protein
VRRGKWAQSTDVARTNVQGSELVEAAWPISHEQQAALEKGTDAFWKALRKCVSLVNARKLLIRNTRQNGIFMLAVVAPRDMA